MAETQGPDAQVFSGTRFIDLSRWVAGEYATKLFADFGADVVKVEKHGEGSLTRHWGPFPGDQPNLLLCRHWIPCHRGGLPPSGSPGRCLITSAAS